MSSYDSAVRILDEASALIHRAGAEMAARTAHDAAMRVLAVAQVKATLAVADAIREASQ